MIRINLIPYRELREKENIRKQISIFFLSFLIAVAILVVYNLSLQKRIDGLNTKIANKKRMLAKIESQAREVDRIKKELEKLEKKTKVIKNLEQKRKDAFFLLDNMTRMVAKNTSNSGSDSLSDNDDTSVKRLWFTDFHAKGDNIDIKGIAMDNKTVADFMTGLENSKLYKKVNLKTLKHKQIRNLKLKSFEITCRKLSLNQPKSQK
jgi:type IV pilus assembly protein PilN